jgi:hypothetical protein
MHAAIVASVFLKSSLDQETADVSKYAITNQIPRRWFLIQSKRQFVVVSRTISCPASQPNSNVFACQQESAV